MNTRMPTYFISHGGGPWPWVPEMRSAFKELERSFDRMHQELPQRPKAILMVSGHWETEDISVMHAANPPMVYDYYNFPPHTYDVVYPAPGAPDLAEKTASLLESTGLPVSLNETQGFDHGTFVPMHVLYPDADVPLFQVSIRKNYDPEQHISIGRALSSLRDDGVLIIGSGLSYHNLRQFGPAAKEPSAQFDAWLTESIALSPNERVQRMIGWEQAPSARICHAQEDHLVPLFVALGAAENDVATKTYFEQGIFGGVTASSFRFG